ncbi:Protein of unknown function [Propionibacterium freudenreichii]|nr:Protein of unknown function [Propionibacterium freudenreichii]
MAIRAESPTGRRRGLSTGTVGERMPGNLQW